MNKENYLNEVEKRLNRIFSASKEGYKLSPEVRHRLEGFMHAGVFLQLVTNAELAKAMDDTHVRIFGKTILQRKTELASSWQEEVIDYGQYEQPAFERKNESQ